MAPRRRGEPRGGTDTRKTRTGLTIAVVAVAAAAMVVATAAALPGLPLLAAGPGGTAGPAGTALSSAALDGDGPVVGPDVRTDGEVVATSTQLGPSSFALTHKVAGDGDTYVFKLRADQDWTLQDDSIIVMDVTYPTLKRDAACAFSFTDIDELSGASVFFFRGSNFFEAHAEVAFGPEVTFNPASPFFQLGTCIHERTGDRVFDGGEDWYFAMAAPEAADFQIEMNLLTDVKMTVLAESANARGRYFTTEEFDGIAQVSSDAGTAATLVSARAVAPAGTRGFAMQFPFRSAGAGWYQVEGPLRSDALISVALPYAFPSAVGVLGDVPGTYEFQSNVEAYQHHPNAPNGRVGIFWAPPIPLADGSKV